MLQKVTPFKNYKEKIITSIQHACWFLDDQAVVLSNKLPKRELCYNRMSSELRSEVTAKLAQGVSMNSILDSIRDFCAGQI